MQNGYLAQIREFAQDTPPLVPCFCCNAIILSLNFENTGKSLNLKF